MPRQVTHAFDVGDVLGIGPVGPSPLATMDGYVTLRLSTALSFTDLHEAEVGRRLLWWDDRSGTFDWATRSIAPGIYRSRLPVPGSNDKTFDEAAALLCDAEQPIPIVIATLALLCFRVLRTPMPGVGAIRCAEVTPRYGSRLALSWYGDRLCVERRGDHFRWPCVFLGSVILANDPAA